MTMCDVCLIVYGKDFTVDTTQKQIHVVQRTTKSRDGLDFRVFASLKIHFAYAIYKCEYTFAGEFCSSHSYLVQN